MSWATQYISKLKEGETVKFRPRGNSMAGKVESGQLCTLTPIAAEDPIEVGHIVLCVVNGRQFLHLVKAVKGSQYQIGNNRGFVNGWTSRSHIYGRVILVED